MVGGFCYVLKGMVCTEVQCSLPKWHWCQSFGDAWHRTGPVKCILLLLVFFLLPCSACLFCFTGMLGDIGVFSQLCKICKSDVTPGENWQGMGFNLQYIVDGDLVRIFSGIWRVTQLGRCRLQLQGGLKLQFTLAVLTRSPLTLVGALTPHSDIYTWVL